MTLSVALSVWAHPLRVNTTGHTKLHVHVTNPPSEKTVRQSKGGISRVHIACPQPTVCTQTDPVWDGGRCCCVTVQVRRGEHRGLKHDKNTSSGNSGYCFKDIQCFQLFHMVSFLKLKTTSVALSLPWTNIKLINTGNQDMQRKPWHTVSFNRLSAGNS